MFMSGSELGRLLCRRCRYVQSASRLHITANLECLRWVVTPRMPTTPLLWQDRWEVLHLFRCSTHTHTPLGGDKTEVPTVRWWWGWQRNESEMRMKMRWKLLNRNTRRGTHKKKRRNQEKTPTPTHLARCGRTLKRQGKRKSGGRRKQTQTGGGGEDRSAWTNLNPSENKTYLSTHGPEPTWNGGARMK